MKSRTWYVLPGDVIADRYIVTKAGSVNLEGGTIMGTAQWRPATAAELEHVAWVNDIYGRKLPLLILNAFVMPLALAVLLVALLT